MEGICERHAVDQNVWFSAQVMSSARLGQVLSTLIGCYRRKPGKDEIVRVTADYIGNGVFQMLRHALLSTPCDDVRYYDWGYQERPSL